MSANTRNPEPPRLVFLGHSCAASAAALAVVLDRRSTVLALAKSGVGARPASPALIRRTRSRLETRFPESARAFAMAGEAGLAPTPKLPASNLELVAVILAGSPGSLPGQPERLAVAAGVPVTWVASTTEVSDALRSIAPDVAIAACFPWRVPRAAYQLPPLGILNIHPSLLPSGRGPQPVFWTLRRGESITGVAVHRMDSGFDTGPIVAQAEMTITPGSRAPDLENELMARGARLLLEALPGLMAGTLQPRPQATHGISLAPIPAPADWTMSPLLPAAWAWRFAHGVAPLGGPLAVVSGGALIPVSDALDWSPDERLPERIIEEADGTLRVHFSPGWVRFRRS